MKRLWVAGASLALASAGALAWAGPSGAQDHPPDLAAAVSPDPVEPGVEVTARSVEPCPAAPDGEPTFTG